MASTILKSQIWRAGQRDGIVAWAEVYHKNVFTGAAQTYRWSDRPSAHGTEYIEVRVVNFGYCARAMSDRDGRLEGATFNFQVADADHLIRAIAGSRRTRAIKGVEVVVKYQRVEDMDAGEPPLVAFRGVIESYGGGRNAMFNCVGSVTQLISKQVVMQKIGSANAAAPFNWREQYGNILYGRLSDEASPGVSPEPAAEADSGATVEGFVTPDIAEAGYGHNGSPQVPVLSASDIAGASSFLAGDNLYIALTGIHDGFESDPLQFFDVDCLHTIGTNGDEVPIEWFNNTYWNGGYYVYIGQDSLDSPNGVEWIGRSFFPASGTPGVLYNDTINGFSWAPAIAFGQIYDYTVTALYDTGESAITNQWRATTFSNQIRPYRLVWTPVGAGEQGYYVYRRLVTNGNIASPIYGPYDRRWTVTTDHLNGDGNVFFQDSLFDDDPTMTFPGGTTGSSEGVVPCIPFGPVEDKNGNTLFAVAIAAHAIKEVENVYTETGGSFSPIDPITWGTFIWAPGMTGWSSVYDTNYYDAPDGSRWTLIFIDGGDAGDGEALVGAILNGTTRMRANVKGAEETGDSTGDLISSGVLQTKHFLQNYALPKVTYKGGLWLGTPEWADATPKLNSDSFGFVNDAVTALIGDTATSWALLAPRQILEVLAERMVDNEMSYSQNAAGQVAVHFQHPMDTPGELLLFDAVHTDVIDIGNQTFQWNDETDPSWFYNKEHFQFRGRYAEGGGVSYTDRAFREDLDAQDEFPEGLIVNPTLVTFAGRRSQTAIDIIESRRLFRSTPPPRFAVYRAALADRGDGQGPLEVGDLVAVTTQDGPGNWVKHYTQIKRLSTSFDSMTVDLTLRDISYRDPSFMEDGMAEFPLGGSLVQSPDLDGSDPQVVQAYDPPGAPAHIPWDTLQDDAVVEALGQAQVEVGITSITIIVWNDTDDVAVGSAVVTATSLTDWSVAIPNPGDAIAREYSLRASVVGALVGQSVQFKGKIRVTL